MELRAVVYGVADEAVGWRWYVSIAMEADLSWWRRRGVEALWVLDPGARVSAGEALERRAALEAGRCGRESSGRPGAWVSASGASWAPEPEAYARWMRRLEGRLLLREEIERMDGAPEPWAAYAQWGALEGRVRLRHGAEREPGSARGGLLGRLRGLAVRLRGRIGGGASSSGARWTGYRCTRCGSGFPMLRLADCALCGGPCPYCEGCLGMGRVRYCAVLVQGTAGGELRAPTESSAPPDREVRARWGLSAAQAEAAGEALRFLRQRLASAGAGRGDGRFLLWAVTGAGKTEMMFPLVEATLIAGGRALVATPRKDVVLELAPRFKAAFPRERVATLYGGSEERWDAGTITIATTHQLFRFREAFELVVLDELDAFPYHGDPQLAFAAERARRPGGAFVLLSATPPPALRREALRGRLPYARVCARFHGRPLPVPRRLTVPPLRRWAASGPLPRALRDAAAASLARGAQLFAFVPRVDAVPGVVQRFRDAFPDVAVGGTSSRDEARAEKVSAFRDRALRVIVTTTILERGVTVPKTDVFVLDADCALFDDASLVQMAGRAGRKAEDPGGFVWFCSADWTAAQKAAIRDVRAMNSEARRKGYLLDDDGDA